MPRRPREKSETGIYHIILRGSNKLEIFHDDEDSMRFLDILEKYKKKSGMEIYGWCLMGNHIHLLLGEGTEELSVTMKRIGVSFVWYYNSKYGTTGHLFQDRYRSEKVENDEYLLTVVRYIHQNPVKAGIVKRAEGWKWSSCLGYYGKRSYPSRLLDKEFVLRIFSDDKNTAITRFKEFNERENEDECLDDTIRIRLTDEEVKRKVKDFLPGLEIMQIKNLPKPKRDEIIHNIKRIEGTTQRQIARILGISSSLVFKASIKK